MTNTGGETPARVRGGFDGWPLVGWAALTVTVVTATILLTAGTGARGVQLVLRATALVSVSLFLAAFVASSLATLWPSGAAAWLVRNRRYLGVSFAVSHTVHLGAIYAAVAYYAADADLFPGGQVDPVTRVAGTLGYLCILAMTATSFDRSAAWLGPRSWKRLHTAGLYYIWVVFIVTYSGRATQALLPGLLTVMLVAALGLRVGRAWRRRAAAPAD